MLITNRSRLQALNLDRPWLCTKEKLATNQVLATMRDGKPCTLAARHVSAGSDVGWTTPNSIQDVLAVIVTNRARDPYDGFFEEKHLRRPHARPGAVTITDFRIRCYADLRSQGFDYTVMFLPIDELADELRVPKVERITNMFAVDHVDATICQFRDILEPALVRPAEANIYFLEHILAAMCAHIAHIYGGMQRLGGQRHGALTPLQQRRVQDQIIFQLKSPPSLKELASSCGLSRSHFMRAFKETTGLPPHRWMLTERVKRAKHLLDENDLSVAEIALECGFTDQSHLTRVFSRSVGTTPGGWRRQRRV
jgi:AraC family transcriptional regulator